jgi:hypothetical protein
MGAGSGGGGGGAGGIVVTVPISVSGTGDPGAVAQEVKRVFLSELGGALEQVAIEAGI